VSNEAAKIEIPVVESTVGRQLAANRTAVAQAEEAYVHATVDGVRWERRGLLRRLRVSSLPLRAVA
jgi:hypothetical protein